MKHEELPDENGAVIDEIDGWKIKQYFNPKAGRWYVSFSQNSPLARRLKRHRLLRSHFVYMRGTGVWEIEIGYVIHHENFDSRQDRFSNLVKMSSAEHDRLHKEYTALHGYPATFKGRKHRPETIEKMREIAQARGNNAVWDCPKIHHFNETRAKMSASASGASNPMFRDDLDPAAINAFYDRCRSLKQTAEHFGCSVSAIRYRLDPTLYGRKENPYTGRERVYQFNDAEMTAFFESHGGRAAAERFGCSTATIYYRAKAYRKQEKAA